VLKTASLTPLFVKATTIDDAWFQCIRAVVVEPGGYEYRITRGSYEGQRRKELDLVTVQITHPGTRPLAPQVPPNCGFSPPTDDQAIEAYCMRYLMSDIKEDNEQYTYGEFLAPQIPKVIELFKKNGEGTNQACMNIGDKNSIDLEDPPCLRIVDVRLRYGRLHFILYFRSWDLFAGFPQNLGGLQLLKEYMADEIGVEDGEIIAISKGLHLYDHFWPLADLRLGRSKE
jgi:thymidylate synthase